MSEVNIILLAAGSSSRMGQSKQQLLIDGKLLLIRSVETAIKSKAEKVIVVLGSEEESHRKILNNFSVDIVANARWQTGIGSSIKTGLSHAMSNNPALEAIIILVCDQPLLTVEHVNNLIATYKSTGTVLVASTYSNTVGVPALFNRKLFDEILNLRDEQGAKSIIQKHSPATVAFPEGGIDLDTPEDYSTFLRQHTKKIS